MTLEDKVRSTIEEHLGKGVRVGKVDVSFEVLTITRPKNEYSPPRDEVKQLRRKSKKSKISTSLKRQYGTGPDDIAIMRTHFRAWDATGKLQENARTYINSLKGVRYPNLRDDQKESILRIFRTHRDMFVTKELA